MTHGPPGGWGPLLYMVYVAEVLANSCLQVLSNIHSV